MLNKIPRLSDLIEAAASAVVTANQRLCKGTIDYIKSFFVSEPDGNYRPRTVSLATNIDQPVLTDALQLPVASLIPQANLALAVAKIDFSQNITHLSRLNGQLILHGHLSSAKGKRASRMPVMSIVVSVKSQPASEGMLRLNDSLNSAGISQAVDVQGVAP
ncbi:DUF2589 domain-containing protein [Undibacterium sp. Rencai35W]|uniref:DUF2589 domain-containing protein n=1 Tax=Undibacterium sp. Rencai35W TaxID=3413046 RepID=UPI003BF4286C